MISDHDRAVALLRAFGLETPGLAEAFSDQFASVRAGALDECVRVCRDYSEAMAASGRRMNAAAGRECARLIGMRGAR